METTVNDLDDIAADLERNGIAQVQFDRPLSARLRPLSLHSGIAGPPVARRDYLRRLGRLCETWGDRLIVRFYGHERTRFDATVLRDLPEIRALIVNCIRDDADNLAVIGELPQLVHLELGVYGLADKQLLHRLPLGQLTYLSIEETNTKALDLAPLSGAGKLRGLALYGHKKNIAAVGTLPGLAQFSFNPSTTVSCDFLNGMRGLRSLGFMLGSAGSLAEITDLPAIEDIALTMVRGLSDLGDLQRFPGLQRLTVSDQAKLQAIETGRGNVSLHHLWFHNCPALSALHGLEAVPELRSLWARKTGLDLGRIAFPPSLTHAAVFSSAVQTQDAERAAIIASGRIPERHPDMPFAGG
ncbi:hypothetical protein [Roseivivax sp. CAU 1753]